MNSLITNRLVLVLSASALALSVFAALLSIKSLLSEPKTAFVVNETLFSGFRGKGDMEKKLLNWKQDEQMRLDSLYISVVSDSNELNKWDLLRQRLLIDEQRLNEQYTQEIWEKINELLSEYSQTEGYDYVFGASGNGSLMYAGEHEDITQKVIEYINTKYEGS